MIESWYPFLVAFLPFLGFMLTGAFGRKLGKTFSAVVSCALPMLSFSLLASVFLTVLVNDAADKPWTGMECVLGHWISFGTGIRSLDVPFVFRLDRLSLFMGMIVTGVGSLIHVYSAGYMADVSDTRFSRFFAYLNLFTGMMMVLVTGGNMLLMFVGWEGVGLCSYLLIGFEYEEDWKAAAGMKAFIVNRVGDLAFILGMLTIVTLEWGVFRGANLGFDHINELGRMVGSLDASSQWWLGFAALCLFIGATGKSAQIPLFVWLPDAMAGPTPVSALIHAATMVTAGVYMIVRLGAFFAVAAIGDVQILSLVAIIGALTAFLAATAAVVQTDIKKVLAYSTVSQLGYMFMGVGAAAYGAAVFHLMTHAFFKALLFLGAGAVIHALHGEQDMRKMGGLSKHLPLCWAVFLVGGLALAGVPPFAGFFSKDMILFHVYERHWETQSMSWLFMWVLGVGSALLTAFYTMRMFCMTFYGPTRLSEDELAHLHKPGLRMAAPLQVLIVLSVVGGFAGLPAIFMKDGFYLDRFLKKAIPVRHNAYKAWSDHEKAHLKETQPEKLKEKDFEKHLKEHFHHEHHSKEWFTMIISLLVAGAGVAMGVMRYRDELPAEPEAGSMQAVGADFLKEAWAFDEFYQTVIVGGVVKISKGLHRWVDEAIFDQSLVDGSGRLSLWISELVTVFQNGRVTWAAVYMALGSLAVLGTLLYSGLVS